MSYVDHYRSFSIWGTDGEDECSGLFMWYGSIFGDYDVSLQLVPWDAIFRPDACPDIIPSVVCSRLNPYGETSCSDVEETIPVTQVHEDASLDVDALTKELDSMKMKEDSFAPESETRGFTPSEGLEELFSPSMTFSSIDSYNVDDIIDRREGSEVFSDMRNRVQCDEGGSEDIQEVDQDLDWETIIFSTIEPEVYPDKIVEIVAISATQKLS